MKKIFFYILFIIFVAIYITFFNFTGKYRDYIAIIVNSGNIEAIKKNFGDYDLYKENNILYIPDKRNNALGNIYLDVSPGKYLLKSKSADCSMEYINKYSNQGLKVYKNLNSLKKNQNIILNLFVISIIIIINYIIFKNLKIKSPKNIFLKNIFVLLLIKIFLSLRGEFQNFGLGTSYGIDILILVVTKFLGFLMCYYAIDKGIKTIKEKKIFYFLFILVSIFPFILIFSIFDLSYYAYLVKYYPLFTDSILCLNKIIDFTKLILLIFICNFLNFRKKIKYIQYLSWIFIFITLIFMEYSIYIFPMFLDGYYFVELMEFIYLYWLLVFFTTRVYNKQTTICIRIMVTFMIAYTVLFFTELVICAYAVIITEGLLELYTWIIKNITTGNNLELDNVFSNLLLTNSIEEFEDQLTFQIENILEIDYVKVLLFKYEEDFFRYISETSSTRNIFVQDEIKLEGFTTGFRISFNNNSHLGLILIQETYYFLNLDEFNFLLDLCEKVASQGNRVRLNSLYKELA
ncbi:hypothetical protein [Cetobacterium sp. SF1]|uniref:hypothetical protein n=1 Tax=Cetobacterium sp. SF1 TaxID=3417654 RepID=UPI003CEB7FCF